MTSENSLGWRFRFGNRLLIQTCKWYIHQNILEESLGITTTSSFQGLIVSFSVFQERFLPPCPLIPSIHRKLSCTAPAADVYSSAVSDQGQTANMLRRHVTVQAAHTGKYMIQEWPHSALWDLIVFRLPHILLALQFY